MNKVLIIIGLFFYLPMTRQRHRLSVVNIGEA